MSHSSHGPRLLSYMFGVRRLDRMDERQEVVEIDLSAVYTPEELQLLLMDRLGFPGWYGRNWNAFWDAITGLVAMPRRLRLVGWSVLAARLPDDARLMRECLDDMAAQYPEGAAEVVLAEPGAAADRGLNSDL